MIHGDKITRKSTNECIDCMSFMICGNSPTCPKGFFRPIPSPLPRKIMINCKESSCEKGMEKYFDMEAEE